MQLSPNVSLLRKSLWFSFGSLSFVFFLSGLFFFFYAGLSTDFWLHTGYATFYMTVSSSPFVWGFWQMLQNPYLMIPLISMLFFAAGVSAWAIGRDISKKRYKHGLIKISLAVILGFLMFGLTYHPIATFAASPTSGPIQQSNDAGYGTSCSASYCIFTNTISGTQYYYAMAGLGQSTYAVGAISYGGPGNAGGASGTNFTAVIMGGINNANLNQNNTIQLATGAFSGAGFSLPNDASVSISGAGTTTTVLDLTSPIVFGAYGTDLTRENTIQSLSIYMQASGEQAFTSSANSSQLTTVFNINDVFGQNRVGGSDSTSLVALSNTAIGSEIQNSYFTTSTMGVIAFYGLSTTNEGSVRLANDLLVTTQPNTVALLLKDTYDIEGQVVYINQNGQANTTGIELLSTLSSVNTNGNQMSQLDIEHSSTDIYLVGTNTGVVSYNKFQGFLSATTGGTNVQTSAKAKNNQFDVRYNAPSGDAVLDTAGSNYYTGTFAAGTFSVSNKSWVQYVAGYNPLGQITNPFAQNTIGLDGTSPSPFVSGEKYWVTGVPISISCTGGGTVSVAIRDPVQGHALGGTTYTCATLPGWFIPVGYTVTITNSTDFTSFNVYGN